MQVCATITSELIAKILIFTFFPIVRTCTMLLAVDDILGGNVTRAPPKPLIGKLPTAEEKATAGALRGCC